MNKFKMNKNNLSIILRSLNNNNILNHNTSWTSILNNNNTLHKGGGGGNFRGRDINQEEDLVKEEAKSYVIIVGNQDIFPEIVKVLQKLVHIVKHLITL